MIPTTSKLRKQRKIFGWIFIVSSVVFIFFSVSFFWPESAPVYNLDANALAQKERVVSFAEILSGVSFLTSLVSLLGFFSTTMLAWRKEKREERYSELESKKKELEIQKLQADLDAQKNKKIG